MKRSHCLTALVIALLALPACETVDGLQADINNLGLPDFQSLTGDGNVLHGACPQVHIVEELATLNEFADYDNADASNLVSQVDINRIESSCKYKSKSVMVDLKLAFAGQLGPNGRAQSGDMPFFSYPFFVAITEPGGDILAKEVFAASITYEHGEDRHTYYESLRHIIPVKHESEGAHYTVMVGFQLSNEQLTYNRKKIAAVKAVAHPETDPFSFKSPFKDEPEIPPPIEPVKVPGSTSGPIDILSAPFNP